MRIGWSSCFYYELELLVVLCLGTLLCHFYLPCHKKEVKLTLSFQTAADPEREKKKKKSILHNRDVFIHGLWPGPHFVIAHVFCGPLHQNNLRIKLFWFGILFYLDCLGESSLRCRIRARLSVEGWFCLRASVVVVVLIGPHRTNEFKMPQKYLDSCR